MSLFLWLLFKESISGKQQCFEVMLEPCCPLGFLALCNTPLICMESEHMGGAELILAAIWPSSSSDAQDHKARRAETATLYDQHRAGGLPWPQAGSHKDEGCSSWPPSPLLWSTEPGGHAKCTTSLLCSRVPPWNGLGGLWLANRSCQETEYTEMVSLACLESSF